MIFVDSGAIIACLDVLDPFHDAAVEGFARLDDSNEAAFTTSACLVEVVNATAREHDYLSAARSGLELLTWEMEIVRPTAVEERRALVLMETYAGKKVGLVDCISFVVMDARQSRTAFTFDHEHFVKVRKLSTWVPIRAKPPG